MNKIKVNSIYALCLGLLTVCEPVTYYKTIYVYRHMYIINCDVGAIAAKGYYTYSGKQHYILDLNCTGNETTVWNCSYNGISGYSCPDSNDASVSCQGLNHAFICI